MRMDNKELELLEEIELEENISDEGLSTEDLFDRLSLNMEIERLENFDKEIKLSDEVKESELFLDAKAECEVFIYMVKTLNKDGIDLQSSGAVAQNYITHKQRLKELEYQVKMQVL